MLARRTLFAAWACGFATPPRAARASDDAWPAGVSAADLQAALGAMAEWIAFYQAGDYHSQWRLTDPRIRRWFDRRRWRTRMQRSRRENGALLSCSITAYAPASSTELPCTEMGHCFRTGVAYVFALVATRYERAAPAQPESCVLARSNEGWGFGGGTILNRPLGETAVILTPEDERRYRPSYVVVP